MPSFRSSNKQAARYVESLCRFSESKHQSKIKGVFSKGTARNYQQALTLVSTWMKNNKLGHSLSDLTTANAKAYLLERQAHVSQSTLNQERQALQMLLGEKLPNYKSQSSTKGLLSKQSRIYTDKQLKAVMVKLTPQQAFAVSLTREAGLRAHELLTIRPIKEQPPSRHRQWHSKQFLGVTGVSYTVIGKGGLIREIKLSVESSRELELYRMHSPTTKIDRGIKYHCHYSLPAGQNLSQLFSMASKSALGWSKELHSTRHMYAQQRMLELMKLGIKYNDALSIVSQNLAHFRPQITETYLR